MAVQSTIDKAQFVRSLYDNSKFGLVQHKLKDSIEGFGTRRTSCRIIYSFEFPLSTALFTSSAPSFENISPQ